MAEKVKWDCVGWLTDRQEGPCLRYPHFHVGMGGCVGRLGKKTEWGMGKKSALCSGSLRTAELLTLTPFVSSSFSLPVCMLVVITPASTCPSRWREEQKWDTHSSKYEHFIVQHQLNDVKIINKGLSVFIFSQQYMIFYRSVTDIQHASLMLISNHYSITNPYGI